ncbi:MAG: hypothetical protein ACREVK_05520 [Gammaproteobacteria bacterium]
MADPYNRTFYPYVEAAEIWKLSLGDLLRHALSGELTAVWEQVHYHPAGPRVLWKLGDDPKPIQPRRRSREFIEVGPLTLERELRRLARGEKPSSKLGLLPDEFERYAATLKAPKRTTKRPSLKEAKNRYRLLLAMAIEGYRFDPTEEPNSAIAHIVQASPEAGGEIDAKTVWDVFYKAVHGIDDTGESKKAQAVLERLRKDVTPAISKRIEGLSPKEECRVLFSMAIDWYGFKLIKGRNSATASIVKSVKEVLGREMDPQTVRNHLRRAANECGTGQESTTAS